MRNFVWAPVLLILGACLWNSCKTPAPPLPPSDAPRYSLSFEGVEAESPARVSLRYSLRGENRAAGEAGMRIRGWKVLVNGEEGPFPDGTGAALSSSPGEGGALLLNLDLDLPEDGGDFDQYHTELTLRLAGAAGDIPLSAAASFPRIRAPEFTIASIAVMKAELINTQFRLDLQIDNPNVFPVTLSSLSYELYGKGRFWARGRERNILEIPARGQAAARLFLEMSFTNMRRELLDEIITLGTVPYRFTGEVLVDTGIPLLPSFTTHFDRQDLSEVLE
ncbi:MAG: LEA type 2 family protein [Treponema sp.]|jgi:LEA14-like dessication related protein|nr:LEA type 2 family protein [Treponema sp.]